MVIDLPGWICSTVSMASTPLFCSHFHHWKQNSCDLPVHPAIPFSRFFFVANMNESQVWQTGNHCYSNSLPLQLVTPQSPLPGLILISFMESPTALAKLLPLIVTDTLLPLPNSCSCHRNFTPYWVPPFCLQKLLVLLTRAVLTSTAAAKSLQSWPTRYSPIDSSPPGSSIHGIFQARVWSGVPLPCLTSTTTSSKSLQSCPTLL